VVKVQRFFLAITIVISVLVLTGSAGAEYGRIPNSQHDPSVVRINEGEFLGALVSGDYVMVDGYDREFTMGSMLGRPLVLVLSYFKCDGACPMTNSALREALDSVKDAAPGRDYRVLTVSFDKNDGAMHTRMFEEEVGLASPDSEVRDGWKVAVMKEKEDIKRLTDSVGFNFFWSARDEVFIHPNVFIFISPDGRVTRYLYAGQFATSDVEVALAEAAFGKEGNSKMRDISDLLLIACYSYNYKEGKYTLNYPLFIGAGSLVFGFSMVFVSIMVFKKRARR
jgi:protein SCO1/2